MAGYSGTPLARKLGIQPDCRLYAENAPADYLQLLDPLPDGVRLVEQLAGKVDVIHLFTKEAAELAAKLPKYRNRIVADGAIWISWPKKAAKVATDITENVVRETALPLGLVDIKVCAVDEIWSGLKLVIRLEDRKPDSRAC
jgi:Protein of unknown function (DUF3052)